MPEVPQRVQVSCLLPHTCGMPTGEILTQKGGEDLRTLPKPSLQFGVVTTNDSTKSGDGSSYPGECWAAAAHQLDQQVEETDVS